MKTFLNTMGVIVAVAIIGLLIACVWTGDSRYFGTASVLCLADFGLFGAAACMPSHAERCSGC